jgi:methionyl-tRNA formyltransferase
MRIVMMGTGGFAVPTFRSLLESPHELLALVTRPPHGGRGRQPLASNPMRQLAEQQGLHIRAPESVNDPAVRAELAALLADLLVVCDYGQILSPETLAVARWGGINLHASLLPKYRGAAPINWALYHGERETGVSVIHMTPRLDAGPLLAVRRTAVGAEETAIELEQRLAELGVAAVHEAIGLLASWGGSSRLGTPQDPGLASRAPRLKKSDALADWSRTAPQLFDQVRALKPWPGTYTHWSRDGRVPLRLILHEVAVSPQASPEPPGTITAVGTRLQVNCGQGQLALLQLQPSGKRVLDAEQFLRGYPLRVGDRLS